MDEMEGYKLAAGQSGCRGNYNYGVKIFVKLDRKLSDDEQGLFYEPIDTIVEGLLKESMRIDPETREGVAKERAEILALFRQPIYVEEIPNGYCSRYCCSFKPWFVVTTSRGPIKIGWRKSVMHLEWTETDVKQKADELFPNEGVTTRYDKVIHCWGYGKAKQYIDTILAAPEIG